MSEATTKTSTIEQDNKNQTSTKPSFFSHNNNNNLPRSREIQLQSGVTHLHHTILDPSSSTFMDLDFTDLDASWSFDQIPNSHFFLSLILINHFHLFGLLPTVAPP